MSGGECLFSGIIPMFVRTGPSVVSTSSAGWTPGWPPVQSAGQYSPSMTPYEMARRCDTMTIEVLLTPTINGKRTLEMKIIDSVDPFFMWHMSLGEEEFFVMKREQSLLIDYSRFPYKLIELLQACVTHGREEHPVYAAWLNVSAGTEDGRRPADAVLSITEATTFRQVPHLSLRFGAVNDATMRKHLSTVIRQYRDEVDGLRSRAFGTAPGPSGHGMYYHQAPPSSMPAPPGAYPDSYQALQDKVRMLEERCAMYETSRFPPSASSAPYGLGPSQPPLQQMPSGPRPANLSALEARLMGVESLAGERLVEIQRLNDIVTALSEQKRELEASRLRLQEELSRRESGSQEAKGEIGKANEIIKKLQDELKSLRARLKTAEGLKRQHEKLAEDRKLTFDTVHSELLETKGTLTLRLKELEAAQESNRSLEKQVKELQERLDENQHVADFLHEELYRLRQETGEHTLAPEYWARQAAALTQMPPGEETSY